MTTRTGKIARLPRRIRDDLNRRLADVEPGVELVNWLNGLPEVQSVLQADFEGRRISEQNLSEWRKGGFLEWQRHREAVELVRELCGNAEELSGLAGELLSDKIATLLIARYMAVIRTLSESGDGAAKEWKMLRELCGDVVALRKGDHSAERLKLERERLRLGFVS